MQRAVLAIECSTGPATIALCKGGRVVAQRAELKANQQSRLLVLMVQEMMKDAAIGFSDIGCVAVTTGPGSFTGIRVGLAAARGFALAADIPTFGMSTLELLAWQAAKELDDFPACALPVLSAGRGEYFAQRFFVESPTRVIAAEEPYTAIPQSIKWDNSVPVLLCGTAQEDISPFLENARLSKNATLPNAATLALLAENNTSAGCPAVPMYIQPPAAKPNL